ncbi:NAD(P)/FAD-dependent oxidoreductase [Lysinibacillus sp. NPDC092081]|uniref:NAD(P)/FAD-dependent oxidoreductase n=1 Tax=Lysinibacillus sp. NPDC092081 TaxID=3364131 RepID=UPI00381E614D
MKNIVIIGGGYAGINLLEGLKKEFQGQIGKSVRVILIDKNSYHFKKVLLVRAAIRDINLKVPFKEYCQNGIEFIQGEALAFQKKNHQITIRVENEKTINLHYDYLVLTFGSVIREVPKDFDGITLKDGQSAIEIKEQLLLLMESFKTLKKSQQSKSLFKVAVVGGGIAGIETAAEIAVWSKEKLSEAGVNPSLVEVLLFDAKDRFLPEAPVKVSEKLVKHLKNIGVVVKNKTRVSHCKDGQLSTNDGQKYSVGTCIFNPGVEANPIISRLGLPISEEHRIIVNHSYQVKDEEHIYSIGDCALVVDYKNNHPDGMTCKEAIPQATRLSKILKASINQTPVNILHESYPVKFFCISLGPNNGFMWTQKWGLDFTITGKIGARIRNYTWELASLQK